MSFSTRITVRFGDTDPAGLVYYPNIFHYLHVAMEEFFLARTGTSYHQLIADSRIGFPTVNTQVNFIHPIVYGDVIDIEVKVNSLGNSSMSLDYQIKRASDDYLCVRANQVHVAMDLNTRRAVQLPSNIRRALTAE